MKVTANSRKARNTASLAASPEGYSTPTAGSGKAATASGETPFSAGILVDVEAIDSSRESVDRGGEVKVRRQRQRPDESPTRRAVQAPRKLVRGGYDLPIQLSTIR
jgi:hypothetical protein